VVPESSVIARGKILAEIVQIPTYTKTEWAVRAFLAFLFLALFILKIFEPRSVRIYLSEALQQEWRRYKARAFDIWLAPEERCDSNPSAMTPFRFQELMVNVYPAIRAEDLNRRRSMKVEQDARATIDRLTAIKDERMTDLKATTDERTEIVSEIDQIVAESEEFFTAFEREQREIVELERILKDINTRQMRAQKGTDDVKSIDLELAKIMAEANIREKRNNVERSAKRRESIEAKLADLYHAKSDLDARERLLLVELGKVDRAIELVRTHRLEDATLSIFAELGDTKTEHATDKPDNGVVN
jgi:hypothetical protein